MKLSGKNFLPYLSLSMFALTGSAMASEDAILFKIHDVVPIKNADGMVTACDLGATFFNRSDKEISNSSVVLRWDDEVVAETIDQEQRNEREAKRLKRTNSVSRYKTSNLSSKDLTLNLKLPTLKPRQQFSLKSKITTDRCFLLLNNVEVNVRSCQLGGGKDKDSLKSGRNGCQGMFKFVSIKDPEYYSEFKEVSLDDQKTLDAREAEQQRQGLVSSYEEGLRAIERLNASLTISE